MDSLEDQIRTPEQIEADNNLMDAINKCLEAYELLEDGFVVEDFVVLTVINRLGTQNVIETRHPMLVRDGDTPWYKIAGLVDIAKIEISLALSTGNSNG